MRCEARFFFPPSEAPASGETKTRASAPERSPQMQAQSDLLTAENIDELLILRRQLHHVVSIKRIGWLRRVYPARQIAKCRQTLCRRGPFSRAVVFKQDRGSHESVLRIPRVCRTVAGRRRDSLFVEHPRRGDELRRTHRPAPTVPRFLRDRHAVGIKPQRGSYAQERLGVARRLHVDAP